MYFLYVDESGDCGLINSPTDFFILSGFVVHELRWQDTLNAIISFRQLIKQRYGLKLREEIHAKEMLDKPGELKRIDKYKRLLLLRDVLDFEASLPDVSVINILVDKRGKSPPYDVFEVAWTTLIQRFENTISHGNFPGPHNAEDFGLLICDRTDEEKLRKLLRKMRRFNPVPNMGGSGSRPMPLKTIVEDPVHRDSQHSYFIQLADVNAYFLLQKERPKKYVRKKGGRNFFDRLDPILCKVASHYDSLGVVRR